LELPNKSIAVSVGIFYKWINGRAHIYLQNRVESGPLDGLLEFPGGKIEPGETPKEALVREIKEEVNENISVSNLFFLESSVFHYEDRTVHLFFFVIDKFSSISNFININEIDSTKIPEANKNVIESLKGFFGEDEKKFLEFKESVWEA
jgi:8-oxo-dGTP diphosphatase